MNFRSDNIHGCPPAILDALARVNDTPTHPYGNDPVTARLSPRFAELFEHEAFAFPVSSGTAANGLSLAAVTPPWGVVFCHPLAHILRDEWCAPEFFTGGARLLTVDGPDEVRAIVEVAHHHGLRVQMDGARFANALVWLGCSPAELSWRLGVDALSFGATKNGTLTAEAVVVFRKDLAEEVAHRRKRAGQVSSKMRFLSAQLEAYLADGLWLANARAANAAAARLAEGLTLAGLDLAAPVQANLVFPRVPAPLREVLRARGFEFLDWPSLGPDVVRLVCGFATRQTAVDALVAACRP